MRNDLPQKKRRNFDVLVQSPELAVDQTSSLKAQLGERFNVKKNSGLSYEDRELNARVQGLLRPEPGEEVHHKNALSLLGVVLDNADDAGKAQIYNLLEHNGIEVGNRAGNLLNIGEIPHDEIHNFAREQGLEMQGRGTKGLAKLLAESTDINKTLEYLQDYIDYGIPLLREKQDELLTAQWAKAKERGQNYMWSPPKK